MMIALATLLLAVASLVSADHEHNVVPLGSGLKLSIPDGASSCPLSFTVPASVVKTGCKLRIRYDWIGIPPITATISFFLKKGGDGNDFAEADQKPITDKEYEGECVEGTFALGVKVACASCILGSEAKFTLSLGIFQDGNAIFEIGDQSKFITSYINQAADSLVIHKYKTTAANQVAHFKMDKCLTCVADTLHYFGGKASDTPATITAGTEISATGTFDTDRLVKITHAEAGEYQFIIKLGSAGSKTGLLTRYQLNETPDVSYGDATCPEKVCSIDDLKSCSACNDKGCNWCAGSQQACVAGKCKADADLIHEEDECPDKKAACAKFDKDCKACLNANLGCIFCDTGATFGISSGTCSSGVDDLGKTCNTVGDAIKITKSFTKAEECAATASSLVMSALAVIALIASMF